MVDKDDNLAGGNTTQIVNDFWANFRQHLNNYLRGDAPAGAAGAVGVNTPSILVPYEGRNVKLISLEDNYHVKLEGITAPVLLTGEMIDPLFTTLFNAVANRRTMAAGSGAGAQSGTNAQ